MYTHYNDHFAGEYLSLCSPVSPSIFPTHIYVSRKPISAWKGQFFTIRFLCHKP